MWTVQFIILKSLTFDNLNSRPKIKVLFCRRKLSSMLIFLQCQNMQWLIKILKEDRLKICPFVVKKRLFPIATGPWAWNLNPGFAYFYTCVSMVPWSRSQLLYRYLCLFVSRWSCYVPVCSDADVCVNYIFVFHSPISLLSATVELPPHFSPK